MRIYKNKKKKWTWARKSGEESKRKSDENENEIETKQIKKMRRTNEANEIYCFLHSSRNTMSMGTLTLFSSNITLTPDSDGVWRRIRFCWFWFGCCGGSCVCSVVWWTCWSMFMLLCLFASPVPGAQLPSLIFGDLLCCCWCSNVCVFNCCSVRLRKLSFIVRFPLESSSSVYDDTHIVYRFVVVVVVVQFVDILGSGAKKETRRRRKM